MSTRISRATFLKGLAGCGAAALAGKVYLDWLHPGPEFPCRLLGPSREVGHRLRSATPPDMKSVSDRSQSAVTIIGGGIAGLSAGWWLKKSGVDDFVILELEKAPGGNSISGKNDHGAYPWGAHYVPLPNQESEYVRQLFEELKIIQSYDASGLPIFDELVICHEPQERLYKDGSFQEGLIPKRGLQKNESDELERFFKLVHGLKRAVGGDGKPAFAIPLDLSSGDEQYRRLDKISMRQWMSENGFKSKPLLWYVNYCCRDDYGSIIDDISAWAGVHYFAGRRGRAANAASDAVVTWPEGNGFLVNRLKEMLGTHIKTNSLVAKVEQDDALTHTLCIDVESGNKRVYESPHAVFAAPRFIARHICSQTSIDLHDVSYAPWMVANITLSNIPDGRGIGLAWDNVSYYSDSLGYVASNHQDISTRQKPFVVTYYYPLSNEQPAVSRKKLFEAEPAKWSKAIVDDLEKMNPGISKYILAMDLWPWGHGMIRPSVGFIWGETRANMQKQAGNIRFAHSDMSGVSNFEEAQYRGVEAAKNILTAMKS